MKIIPQEWAQPHTVEQIVNVSVPQVVEVHTERLSGRIIEQNVYVPLLQILKETVEAPERLSERIIEQIIYVPVSLLLAETVEVVMLAPQERVEPRTTERVVGLW